MAGFDSTHSGEDFEKLFETVENKQDLIPDLEAIREGAKLGKTSLQSIPKEYVTEQTLWDSLKGKQDLIPDLEAIRKNAKKGATSLQNVKANGKLLDIIDGLVDIGSTPYFITGVTIRDIISSWGTQPDGEPLDFPISEEVYSGINEAIITNRPIYIKEDPGKDNYGNILLSITKYNTIGFTCITHNGAVVIGGISTKTIHVYELVHIPEIVDLVTDFNADIASLYESKQDTLVSGETIKTINGKSLLGKGDIKIVGGEGGEPQYITDFNLSDIMAIEGSEEGIIVSGDLIQAIIEKMIIKLPYTSDTETIGYLVGIDASLQQSKDDSGDIEMYIYFYSYPKLIKVRSNHYNSADNTIMIFSECYPLVDYNQLTPYVTKFNVSEIQAAIDRESTFTITKEFFDAVEQGRLVVIPESDGENQPQIVTKCGYYISDEYRSVAIQFISPGFSTIYIFRASIEYGTESIEMPGAMVLSMPLQERLIDGETFATINGQTLLRGGNLVINEPYLAPFTVRDLEGAISSGYMRFPKDEFITAVVSGRPLIVPIHYRDNSGITSSYYIAITETGKEIVVDVIHGSKVYHLILEDILEQPYITISPDNVSLQDTSDVYVTDFTLKELLSGRTVTITEQFVNAIQANAQIFIPASPSGYNYAVVTYLDSSISTDNLSIRIEFTKDRQLYGVVFTNIGTTPSQVVPRVTVEDLITSESQLRTINGVSVLGRGDIDVNNIYVLPYTFNEIQTAASQRAQLSVDLDFVNAVNSKKQILIPNGKTVADGQYISVFYTIGSVSESGVSIILSIFYGTKTVNIRFSSKSQAPTAASVNFDEAPLLTEKMFYSIYGGDSTTVTRPNSEFTVDSIDGASFTNDGKTTAMTPNTVYNFVNNGVNRTIAVYDDHRVVITSENNSTVALSPAVVYTSKERILPSVLPSSLVTKPELREALSFTPNYMCNDKTRQEYIEGRTHFPTGFTAIGIGQKIDLSAHINIKGTLDDFRILWSDGLHKLPTNIDDVVSIPSKNNCAIRCAKIGENQFTVYFGDSKDPWPTFISPFGLVYFSWKYDGSFKEIDKIYLPDDIVYTDELPQSDWNELDSTKPSFVVNRTHFAGLKGMFYIGRGYSLADQTGSHSPDSYRIRYKGELYKLPNVGETSFIPNEAEAIFSIELGESSSGSTTTYNILSTEINAEGEESIVEVISVKNSKKLDDLYLPVNVTYNDKLKTINGESLAGKGDIKLVTKEEWDNKGYTYKFIKITSAGEYEITPPGGGLKDICVIFNQKTFILEEYVRTQVWSGPSVYVTLKHPDDGSYYLEVEDSSGSLSEYPLLYVKEATPFPSVLIPTELLPQSDWTETDESKSTYIKNRSHYWKSMGPGTYELELTESSIGTTIASVGDYFMLYESVYHTSEVIGKDIEIPRWGPSLILTVIEEDGTYYLKHLSGTSYPGPTIRYNAYVSVKTLDDVYIPDTIARVKDLESIVPRKQTGSEVPDKLLPNVFYEFSNINSFELPPLEGESIDRQNKWTVSVVLESPEALVIRYKVQWANGQEPQFAEYSILVMTFYKTATGVIYGEWKAYENKFLDVYPKETMWLPYEDDGTLDTNFEVKSNTKWEIK